MVINTSLSYHKRQESSQTRQRSWFLQTSYNQNMVLLGFLPNKCLWIWKSILFINHWHPNFVLKEEKINSWQHDNVHNNIVSLSSNRQITNINVLTLIKLKYFISNHPILKSVPKHVHVKQNIWNLTPASTDINDILYARWLWPYTLTYYLYQEVNGYLTITILQFEWSTYIFRRQLS